MNRLHHLSDDELNSYLDEVLSQGRSVGRLYQQDAFEAALRRLLDMPGDRIRMMTYDNPANWNAAFDVRVPSTIDMDKTTLRAIGAALLGRPL